MNNIADLLAASRLPTHESPAHSLADGTKSVYVHAGQLFVSAEPAQITTILGSCVAICVWDVATKTGGLNHYMLPHDVGANVATPRYARYAFDRLLADVLRTGASASRLQAKVFGGASVITALRGDGRDLGSKNVEVAHAMLAEARIPIVAEDTGGNSGRKLIFRTDDGSALIRRVQS